MNRRRFLMELRGNKSVLVGGVLTLILVCFAILAPLSPYPYDKPSLDEALQGPSIKHLFGTDALGRDILSRLMFAVRTSILIALASVSIALIFGVSLGLFSGYFGGKIDLLIMRLADMMLTFPTILVAIVIVALIGKGLTNVLFAIGISSIPIFIRLSRNQTVSLKEEVWVMAAEATGESNMSIIFKYILPNFIPTIITQATIRIGMSILVAASLGFLGIGVQPPLPELGLMISESRSYFQTVPHILFFPAIILTLITLGFNLLGDGLTDAISPKVKK